MPKKKVVQKKVVVTTQSSLALFKAFIERLPKTKTMYSRSYIRLGRERIDVALAYAILEHNTCNRILRQGTVNNYVKDMQSKTWNFCSAMLVLSNKGILLDGQHRLYAIIESGKPQEFTVVYGLHQDVQKYIDIGPGRSLADVLKLDKLVGAHHTYVAGIINRMMNGSNTSYGKNRTEQLAFFDKHEHAILWATSIFKTNWAPDVSTAPVAAAVARAWYYVDDPSRLERFVDILKEGTAEPSEKVVIALRDWLRRPEYRGGAPKAAETFLRTQYAICAFVQKIKTKKLAIPEKDLYPLPEVDPVTGIANGRTGHKVAWYRERYNGTTT